MRRPPSPPGPPRELKPLSEFQVAVTFAIRFLSDFPFCYLTKDWELLSLPIDFSFVNPDGSMGRWQVIPNNSPLIGAPGIDAHQVLVQLLQPAIDDLARQGKDIRVVKLGSVRDCLRRLGWIIGGWQQRDLLRSLTQISATTIFADVMLPTDQIDDTGTPIYKYFLRRYHRFDIESIGGRPVTQESRETGKYDPNLDLDGDICIRLSDAEMAMQSLSRQPMDNEYLFSVSPTARRCYELIEPRIYGVVKNKKIPYCDFSYVWYTQRHHTLKRWTDLKRIKEQFNNVISDHLAFKYVEKVEYLPVHKDGKLDDVIIRLWAGPEAQESTKRIRERIKQLNEPKTPRRRQLTFRETTAPEPLREPAPVDPLVAELITHQVSRDQAEELNRLYPERCRVQIDHLDFLMEQGSAPDEPGAWLAQAIRADFTLPKGFKSREEREAERKAKEEKKRRREAAIEQKRQEELENQRQQELELQRYQALEAQLQGLSELDRAKIEAVATDRTMAQLDEDVRKLYSRSKFDPRSGLHRKRFYANLEELLEEHRTLSGLL